MDTSNRTWKFELVFGFIIIYGTIPNRGGIYRDKHVYPYLVGLWSDMDGSNRTWKFELVFSFIIIYGTIPNRGGI